MAVEMLLLRISRLDAIRLAWNGVVPIYHGAVRLVSRQANAFAHSVIGPAARCRHFDAGRDRQGSCAGVRRGSAVARSQPPFWSAATIVSCSLAPRLRVAV